MSESAVTIPVARVERQVPGERTSSRASRVWRRWYFPVVSSVILLLSLVGFSDNLFTDVRQESNSQPHFVVHGSFWLAWMILLVVQSSLVNRRRIATHRALGVAGGIIALGVVASTFWVFVVVWNGWEAMPFHVKANRIFTTAFVVAVALALYWRRHSQVHRRLLLLGTIFTLGPVLDRAAGHLDVNVYVFNLVVWNVLFVSLLGYDRATAGRVHRLSLGGYALFYAVWVVSLVL